MRLALFLWIPWLAVAQAPAPKPEVAADDQVIKMDVDLVNLFFSVRDKRGGYISSLTKDDLEFYEEGKRQTLKAFTRETDLPLTIGLLVDVSGSQGALIEEERGASLKFFSQVLRKKDMAFIISFGADTELLQDFTNSVGLLDKGLRSMRLNAGVSGMSPTGSPFPGSGRGTVLYEAVWLAAKEKLNGEVGRKAIVMITDGNDVGSRTRIESAIEAAQRADTIIYVILFEDPRYTSGMFGGMSGEGPMRRMAEETGGRVFRVGRRNTLDQIYAEIQQEMRSQYAAAYSPGEGGSGYRHIEVKAKDKNYRVQVRKGYYAQRN